MDTTPQTRIEPDVGQMLQHLEHLFGGDLDGCHEGRIELAWTDARDGRLRHAEIFGTDQMEELAERAAAVNAVPGQNVYIGVALRKPDIPPFGRCKDEDFFALTAFYADLDDEGAAGKAKERYQEAPPTAVVVTGRHPHLRAQMLWRQEIPERDAAACRRQNLTLAESLDGDRTVVNPSRVLRLAGSIAWPAKPGRIVERTEFHVFDDGRPKVYLPGQIAKVFPPAPTAPAGSLPHGGAPLAPQPTAQVTSLNIGTEFDGVSVEACLARIRAGDHWHDTLVRLTGHWIARGWSDAEILAAAASLTLPGYTVDQTTREVAAMISGGRSKWNVPNPEHRVEDAPNTPVLDLMAWTAERYQDTPQPIRWLCKGTIPLGVPGMLAAMGGVGKSFLALDLTLNIAAGIAGFEQPKFFLGGQLAVEGTAVMITAEDSFDAVHRRLDRIDPQRHSMRHPRRLIIVPLPDAGIPAPLIASDGKTLARTPMFAALKTQLMEIPDLRLVVIDPLQAFVLADVNADPAAAQFLWSALAELAAATGATVLVTHHMRKDGGFNIRTSDDAREAVRGTTALVDGGRFTYALWKLDDSETKTIGERLGIEAKPGGIIHGALVKSNDEADYSIRTYVRSETGLLEQCESEPEETQADSLPGMTKVREILEEVQRRFDQGVPFSHASNSGARYLVPFLIRQHGMNRLQAQDFLTDWLNNGVVGIDVCDRKTKLTGLKVLKWI